MRWKYGSHYVEREKELSVIDPTAESKPIQAIDYSKLDGINFFFILGRSRSGTTLIRTLLDAHQQVIVPPESTVIVDLYRKYLQAQFTKEKILEFYHDLLREGKFKTIWDIDREKLKNDLLNCPEPDFYKLFKIVYLNYRSPYPHQNILLVGDKNPLYCPHTAELIKIFPSAKFLFISRDYRDNIISHKRIHATMMRTTSVLAHNWLIHNRSIFQEMKKHPQKFLFFKYEDLAAEPAAHLKSICTFLGLDYSDSLLDFYKGINKENKHIKGIMEMHQNLSNPVNTSRTNLWQKQMTTWQIKQADLISGKMGEQLGYERRYKNFSLAAYLFTRPGVFYSTLSTNFFHSVMRMPVPVKNFIRSMMMLIHVPEWVRLTKKQKKNDDTN